MQFISGRNPNFSFLEDNSKPIALSVRIEAERIKAIGFECCMTRLSCYMSYP